MIDHSSPDSRARRLLRRDDVKSRNELLTERARRHRFYSETRLPLICECDNPNCAEFVRITADEYQATRSDGYYVVHPGHRLAGAVTHDDQRHEYTLVTLVQG